MGALLKLICINSPCRLPWCELRPQLSMQLSPEKRVYIGSIRKHKHRSAVDSFSSWWILSAPEWTVLTQEALIINLIFCLIEIMYTISFQLYKLGKTDKLFSLNLSNARRTNNRGKCCPAWKRLHNFASVDPVNVPIIQKRKPPPEAQKLFLLM